MYGYIIRSKRKNRRTGMTKRERSAERLKRETPPIRERYKAMGEFEGEREPKGNSCKKEESKRQRVKTQET